MQFSPNAILVPVDVGSEEGAALARETVEGIAGFAAKHGAKVLLSFAPAPLDPLIVPEVSTDTAKVYQEVIEARRAHSRKRLHELAEGLTEKEVSHEALWLEQEGSVPERICEAARVHEADLIVISSHGRTGMKRLLLGSVAERVAHLSEVPVLLFKPEIS